MATIKNFYFCRIICQLLLTQSLVLGLGIRAEDPSLEDVYNSMIPPVFKDDWHIHDPSRIIATNGLLMIANTGKAQEDGYNCGLETWYMSPGDTDWQPGQCLFTQKPAWIEEELPGNDGAFWAPTLISSDIMYYSVPSMDEEEDAQCIGLAFATGTVPNQKWEDSGAPITCSFDPESNADENDMPNSIDPAVFEDEFDDSAHLVYGGNRIWMTELNPNSGMQIEENWWEENDPTYHFLAKGPESYDDPDESEWIEAPYLHKHDSFYYLFVNWFGCCNGIDSTYEIHVGRSYSRTGPYLDKNGIPMTEGGGSLFMKKEGRYIGPGHAAVFSEGGRNWFSYHFYDEERDGLPWVGIQKLQWEAGWPKVTGERFNATAYFGQ